MEGLEVDQLARRLLFCALPSVILGLSQHAGASLLSIGRPGLVHLLGGSGILQFDGHDVYYRMKRSQH